MVNAALLRWSQSDCHIECSDALPPPQTQSKIERWHQSMKNRVLLENYYLPSDLERHIEAFIDCDNNQRYHQSPNDLTPSDLYQGRGDEILKLREKIKKQTIQKRRL